MTPTTDTNTPVAAPATTPVQTSPAAAENAADKAKIADLRIRIKNGESLSSTELVFLKLGNSALTDAAILAINSGGGLDKLKSLGLKENQAYEVISTYHVKTDPARYESELALKAIDANPELLGSFISHLKKTNTETPSLTPLFNTIRTNAAVYGALRDWNAVNFATSTTN
jgi:hypothetical protein